MAKKQRAKQEQTPLVVASKLERKLTAIDAELDRRVARETERHTERLQQYGQDAWDKREAVLATADPEPVRILFATGVVAEAECSPAVFVKGEPDAA